MHTASFCRPSGAHLELCGADIDRVTMPSRVTVFMFVVQIKHRVTVFMFVVQINIGSQCLCLWCR